MTTSKSRDLVGELCDPRRRIAAPAVERRRPEFLMPGLYAWWTDRAGSIELSESLGLRIRPGLIYAGQAGAGRAGERTLYDRLLRNHIAGKTRNSTFRKSLAAALHRSLPFVSCLGGPKRKESEQRLSSWILLHLGVSVVACDDASTIFLLEDKVLRVLDPPLNIKGMPGTPIRAELTRLRDLVSKNADTSAVRSVARDHGAGPTPEALARELGFPDGKRIRSFLRRTFPRPDDMSGSRWGSLTPEMVSAVHRWAGR